MLIGEAIENFLFHGRYGKNLSPRTLKAYSIDLKQFCEHLALQGVSEIERAGKVEIREFIRVLFERHAEKTVKRKVATLKSLFGFLEREDVLTTSPFRKMDIRIKETRRIPRTVGLAELERFFVHLYRAKAECSERESEEYRRLVRDIAVFETLFATGARVSEICHLTEKDVSLDLGRVRVLGKGGKERAIEILDDGPLTALREYKALWAPIGEGEYFFQSRTKKRLGEQSVRLALRQRVAAAALGMHVTPHMFRHSLATLLLEQGVDIRYIQNLLGHSSITTTQIYAQARDREQWRIVGSKHPRRLLAISGRAEVNC